MERWLGPKGFLLFLEDKWIKLHIHRGTLNSVLV